MEALDKKILNFEEFIFESEQERIDEGWKEAIIAGALSLAAIRGGTQPIAAPGDAKLLLKEPQRKEYVEDQQKKEEKISVNFGSEFKSGTYKFDKNKTDDIEEKLGEIGKFVKMHPKTDITIRIEASESKVPNIDAETGERLKVGDLAEKRANVTKDMISTFMDSLTKKGVRQGRYYIETETKVGNTPWRQGDKASDEKFTREQYVKVDLEVKTNIEVKTDEYSAYATMGERIFRSSNYHAFGDIFYVTKETKKLEEPGMKNTGYENVLLKTLTPEKEFLQTGKMYTGKTYLIPSEWLNKNVATNKWNDEQINYILQNFEIK